MQLEDLRKEIDAIDDKIAALFTDRMAVSKKVGELKAEKGMLTENALREKEIINRVTDAMPDDIKLFGKQIFEGLFDASKAYQLRFAAPYGKTVEKIRTAASEGAAFPVSATVACQGVEGAYSSIAAGKLFDLSKNMYFKDFEGVFSAVEKGLCEYGVLPIENSSVGSVNAVYDLMRKHSFYIVKSIKLRVQHHLLAPIGTDIADIKEIYSHEQAIGQCKKFFSDNPKIKVTVVSNTALAAKMVAESGRKDAACIASRECGGIYGLKTVLANLQDNENNYTRFIAISKRLRVFEGADKISITLNLPHETGSLNKLLNKFSTLGLNLTKLESRPIGNTSFEFAFYFDFEADIRRPEVQSLIGELDAQSEMFVFLGSYKEIQ